ncbi:MAG: hypothetical protein QGH60_00070 [Phycisphaerae bacterium]|jgi:hypothetical protein|nr:hypothetical protein [Phycisphaerae bacterium]
MNLPAYILAAKGSDAIEIIGFVIFIGLAIIGSLFQKARANKEQEEKNRKPRERSAPPTVQPIRPAPPVALQAGQPVRVSEELRLRQQRQTQLERDRQQRLSVRASPESDTDAIEAHLVSLHSEQATDTEFEEISEVGVIPGLQTPADARRAIILHEIFSPPKALRKGGEMWDT